MLVFGESKYVADVGSIGKEEPGKHGLEYPIPDYLVVFTWLTTS